VTSSVVIKDSDITLLPWHCWQYGPLTRSSNYRASLPQNISIFTVASIYETKRPRYDSALKMETEYYFEQMVKLNPTMLLRITESITDQYLIGPSRNSLRILWYNADALLTYSMEQSFLRS